MQILLLMVLGFIPYLAGAKGEYPEYPSYPSFSDGVAKQLTLSESERLAIEPDMMNIPEMESLDFEPVLLDPEPELPEPPEPLSEPELLIPEMESLDFEPELPEPQIPKSIIKYQSPSELVAVLLSHPNADNMARTKAARLLGEFQLWSEKVGTALFSALEKDSYWWVRANSAMSLGRLSCEIHQDPETINKIATALIKIVSTSDSKYYRFKDVQSDAVQALGFLSSCVGQEYPDAVNPIIDITVQTVLNKKLHSNMRRHAVDTLRKLGVLVTNPDTMQTIIHTLEQFLLDDTLDKSTRSMFVTRTLNKLLQHHASLFIIEKDENIKKQHQVNANQIIYVLRQMLCDPTWGDAVHEYIVQVAFDFKSPWPVLTHDSVCSAITH